MSNFRICNTCKLSKSFEDFHKDKHTKLGITTICKNCIKARYKANPQKYLYRSAKERLTLKGKARNLLHSCKLRSQSSNIPFELDIKWVIERLEKGICELSGLKFSDENPTKATISPYTPSIDKVIPKDGYTKDNSRMICFIINQAKRDWNDDILINVSKAITNKFINN